VDAELVRRLKKLISKCEKVQAVENPEAWDMMFSAEVMPEVVEFGSMCDKQEYELREEDYVRSVMYSRACMKAMKLAAIATVFNYTEDDQDSLIIKSTEWEWAKQMVEYEMSNISFFFGGAGIGNTMEDLVRRVMVPTILNILRGKYAGKKCPSKHLRDRQTFTWSNLYQCLRHNKEINALNDDSKSRSKPISGLHKLVDYMISNGLLRKVEDTSRSVLYKITHDFAEISSK
jgi:hypothetical protein